MRQNFESAWSAKFLTLEKGERHCVLGELESSLLLESSLCGGPVGVFIIWEASFSICANLSSPSPSDLPNPPGPMLPSFEPTGKTERYCVKDELF